jgi:IS30 family transposase
MSAYTYLTQEQPYQISAPMKAEHSQTEMAAIVRVHESPISRESRHNCGLQGHRLRQANQLALRSAARRRSKALFAGRPSR